MKWQEKYPLLNIHSQRNESNERILQTVIVIKGDLPDMITPKYRQVCNVTLNEKCTAKLQYYPNGVTPDIASSKYVTLFLSIEYEDEVGVYARISTAAICKYGGCWFESRNRFQILPYGMPLSIERMGAIEDMMQDDYFVHDSSFLFEIRIEIDTTKKVNIDPGPEIPLSTIQRMKNAVHDPNFGDFEFIVGGIKMYAHKEVVPHIPVIGTAFKLQVTRNDRKIDYQDVCPQVFKRYLISGYFRSPNWSAYLEY